MRIEAWRRTGGYRKIDGSNQVGGSDSYELLPPTCIFCKLEKGLFKQEYGSLYFVRKTLDKSGTIL